MSIRSKKYNISKVIEKALEGTNAIGGGHEHAVGVVVKVEEFDTLMSNFKRELKQAMPE